MAKVTKDGTPDFVPLAERIAVFDNDGTLWPENPMPFQVAFVLDELKRRRPDEPKLAEDPMVKAALAGDVGQAAGGRHHDGLMRVIALTHAGMTTDEFQRAVEAWLATARHPRFDRPYDELIYQPMQEVLRVPAGERVQDVHRVGRRRGLHAGLVRAGLWHPARASGWLDGAGVKFELRDSGPVLVKTIEQLFVDDKEGKPVGIHQFIGRRPIDCFGNSDGDQAMLQYTTIKNPRPSFGLIVHHTDAEREYAYDANPKSSGKLVEALKEAPARGWTVVDMKRDWNASSVPSRAGFAAESPRLGPPNLGNSRARVQRSPPGACQLPEASACRVNV